MTVCEQEGAPDSHPALPRTLRTLPMGECCPFRPPGGPERRGKLQDTNTLDWNATVT
jgi:hypothetical protein